jgi:hypothetical protein
MQRVIHVLVDANIVNQIFGRISGLNVLAKVREPARLFGALQAVGISTVTTKQLARRRAQTRVGEHTGTGGIAAVPPPSRRNVSVKNQVHGFVRNLRNRIGCSWFTLERVGCDFVHQSAIPIEPAHVAIVLSGLPFGTNDGLLRIIVGRMLPVDREAILPNRWIIVDELPVPIIVHHVRIVVSEITVGWSSLAGTKNKKKHEM